MTATITAPRKPVRIRRPRPAPKPSAGPKIIRYHTHAELAAKWAKAITSLRGALADIDALDMAMAYTLDLEQLEEGGSPTIEELADSDILAISWQLRQAIRHVSNNAPACVDYLLGKLEVIDAKNKVDAATIVAIRRIAFAQLGLPPEKVGKTALATT